MRKFEAVLFDIDGTLLDTTEFIFQAFEHALHTHGVHVKDRRFLRGYIGTFIIEIYKAIAPGVDPYKLLDTHSSFQARNTHLVKPYRNTVATLKKLKKHGFKVAALTNRMRTGKKSIEAGGIADYVDLVVTPDDGTKPKPHPDLILKALKHFGITTSAAIMVGDSHNDILAGKHARTKTIGATYGFLGKKIANYNPDFLIHDIADILPIILES